MTELRIPLTLDAKVMSYFRCEERGTSFSRERSSSCSAAISARAPLAPWQSAVSACSCCIGRLHVPVQRRVDPLPPLCGACRNSSPWSYWRAGRFDGGWGPFPDRPRAPRWGMGRSPQLDARRSGHPPGRCACGGARVQQNPRSRGCATEIEPRRTRGAWSARIVTGGCPRVRAREAGMGSSLLSDARCISA